MGCYIQLLEQTKDGWRIRFGGPSDEFWTMLSNFKTEQKFNRLACFYDQSFFQGKGGWFCTDTIFTKYRLHFDNYDFMRQKAEKVYEASGKAEEDRREKEAKAKAKQEAQRKWEEAQKRQGEEKAKQRQEKQWEQARHDYSYQHKQPVRPNSNGLTLTEAKTVLGLSPVAQLTEKEVKVAYRLKARQTHPDAGGSHQAFVKVNLAYQLVMFNVSEVKV